MPDAGYRVVDCVLDPSEMSTVETALSSGAITRSRAGSRGMLALPEVRAMANGARLLTLAAEFIGASAFPFRATLFDKSPDANWLVTWHQDTALPLKRRVNVTGWGPWTTKAGVLHAHAPAAALAGVVALRIHLDDSTVDNGPLRVIPESHLDGRLSSEGIEEVVRSTSPVDCLAPAGGVVVMRPLILHASSKSRTETRRRVLHIEYSVSTDFGAGLELNVM